MGWRVCDPDRVPCVMSVEALAQAVAGFVVEDLDLELDPAAVAVAQWSVEESGLLLLGELHGVRENPLLARALMRVFGLTRLALEWPEDLTPVIETFQGTGTLADHWLLWAGDGRITAGHLAVLAERAAAGPVPVVLFDGTIGAGWSWSDRDEAMAGRILAAAPPRTRMLVAAGNAHTPTGRTELGVPMGSWLARKRPGVREIRINYGGGRYYNMQPREFARRGGPARRIRLHQERDTLELDLPAADEAVVPQQSELWPPRALTPDSGRIVSSRRWRRCIKMPPGQLSAGLEPGKATRSTTS
jgi:hypothetical protein